MTDPHVSVVIPTYYRNDLLRKAVDSALEQSYEAVSVTVVDDSGEAHAEPVVSAYDHVSYIAHEESRGAHHARETGFRRSSGEFVQFLDDDDQLHPAKLERQLTVFDRHSPGTGVVYCGAKMTGGHIERPDPDADGDVSVRALTFEMWPCMTSTMLFRRPVLGRVLPFSDREAGQDLELMIRLSEFTEFAFVDAPLVFKRVDESSLGHSQAAFRARLDIVEDYSDRYDRHPDAVRRTAVSNAYRTRGQMLLQKHVWSPRALLAYWRSLRHSPGPGPELVAEGLSALLGRPGLRVAEAVGRRL